MMPLVCGEDGKNSLFKRIAARALIAAIPATFAFCQIAFAQDLAGQAIISEAQKVSEKPKIERPKDLFLVSGFNATSQNKLSLFSSVEGINFTSLASETFTPPKGLLRDPSIMRHIDGFYYIAYTTDWNGKNFAIARSRNLSDWTLHATIEMPIQGVTNTWAPEWFKDNNGKIYIIVSISKTGTNGTFAPHILEAKNGSLNEFTSPFALKGLSGNYIDMFIVKANDEYRAILKNETTKHLELASAKDLLGEWKIEKSGDWAGLGAFKEGPSLVETKDGNWRLYYDDYINKKYYYSDSDDTLEKWTKPQEVLGISGAVRHFTAIKEPHDRIANATRPLDAPKTITFDKYSLIIGGKRTFIFAGEMHPFRLPSPSLWRDIMQKMKASGLNTVSFYFDWGYHTARQSQYDFSSIRNMELAIKMAKEEGLYVIIRSGPYVNAELTGGGFPGWMFRNRAEARTDAAEYQAATDEWMTQINAIVARHQITNGGGSVILYQIENELGKVEPKHQRHMKHLREKAIADGINVPIFHNAASRLPDWTPFNSSAPFANPGPTDIYAFDGYPGGTCSVDAKEGSASPAPDWGMYGKNAPKIGSLASPNTPGFLAEIGAGWFDYWGSNGTYECTARRQGTGYTRLFYGKNIINNLTIHNAYMMHGGTSWGWLAAPMVYTSYDYGAPINEARVMRDKAKAMGQLGQTIASNNDALTHMEPGAPIITSNKEAFVYHNYNSLTQSHILFVSHSDSTKTNRVDFSFNLNTSDGNLKVPSVGTMTINGQDGKLLYAAHSFGTNHLIYSTNELQTHFSNQSGNRTQDFALFVGRKSEAGEIALKFDRTPKVEILEGHIEHNFNFETKALVLRFNHDVRNIVKITNGNKTTLIIVENDVSARNYSLQGENSARFIINFEGLFRSSESKNQNLSINGDIANPTKIEIFAPFAPRNLNFNSENIAFIKTNSGAIQTQTIRGTDQFILPSLKNLEWYYRADNSEAKPDFDDSNWTLANRTGSAANVYTQPERGQPTLAMSDYGFHHGDVWYRGDFEINEQSEKEIDIFYGAGAAGLIQVWIDGVFVGQHETDAGRAFSETTDSYKFKMPNSLNTNGKHKIAVMVRNNGHNWDLFADDMHKEARGVIAASLHSLGGQRFGHRINWKIQGNRGGEDIADIVRGPMNNGGLGGERAGWYLPPAIGLNRETAWLGTSLDRQIKDAGTHWLRADFALDLPKDHDIGLAIGFGDTTKPRSAKQYRVLIFVNGWNMGQMISHIGPQRTFIIPPGILNNNGNNHIALAYTTDGKGGNEMEEPKLIVVNNVRGGIKIEPVPQPKSLAK